MRASSDPALEAEEVSVTAPGRARVTNTPCDISSLLRDCTERRRGGVEGEVRDGRKGGIGEGVREGEKE